MVNSNDVKGLLDAVQSITPVSFKTMKANIPAMKKKYNREQQEQSLLAAYGQAGARLS